MRETDLQVPGATLEMDKPLMRRARGYVLDVCVYENHTSVGSKIKAGLIKPILDGAKYIVFEFSVRKTQLKEVFSQ